jgi:NAD+ kinase
MHTIKSVGIISKPNVEVGRAIVPALLDYLRNRGITVQYDEATAAYAGMKDGLERERVPEGTQLLIVMGGDGTLLSAARAVGGRDVPVFAVNLGGLGFLTTISTAEIYPELERALGGESRVSRRRLLDCKVLRGDEVISQYEALNDVVLSKADLARMIDLEAYVDKRFVCSYKADGLIIATPTGSTAYSLSAGGPIIFPQVSALAMTPICPHMLTNRPVIVPDASEIAVVARSGDQAIQLTIDGQVGETLRNMDRVVARSSGKSVRLVRPPKMMFFDVLRAKLKWGER